MSRHRTFAVSLLVAAATWGPAVAPRTASAAAITSKHQDPVRKFSFLYYDDWAPVPVGPRDDFTVAKYVESGATGKGRGAILTELDVARRGPDEKPDGTCAAGTPAGTDEVFGRFTKQISAAGFEPAPAASASKPIKSKDGVPGRIWAFETQKEEPVRGGGAPRVVRAFNVVACWRKEGGPVEYGMLFGCDGTQRKHFEPGFRQIAASFQWLDAKAQDVATVDALADVKMSPARRHAIAAGRVKGWAVLVSPQKQYVVVDNTKGKRNDVLAKVIAERVEAIREQLYETQFPPTRTIEDVSVIRICGDRGEYLAYGAPSNSAGFWNPHDEELVFYDSSPATKVDDDTIAVLYHEAFHQYIHYSVGGVDPQSWFNEGHGDYYSGARYVNGKFTIHPFSWRIGVIKAALHAGPSKKDAKGDWDRKKEGYTPLQDFTSFTQGDYYAYANVCYAEGWSLIYFLREIVPKKPDWNAKWGRILDVYFKTLQGIPAGTPASGGKPTTPDDPAMGEPAGAKGKKAGGDVDEAMRAAFDGVDWAELEAAWKSSIASVPG